MDKLAERTRHHNAITGSLAIALAEKGDILQLARSLLAVMAESTGQHHTITASPAIVLAGRMTNGSWHWA